MTEPAGPGVQQRAASRGVPPRGLRASRQLALHMITSTRVGLPYTIALGVIGQLMLAHVPSALCLAWSLAFVLMMALRAALTRAWFASPGARRAARGAWWRRGGTVLSLAHGLLWGAAGFLGIVFSPLPMQEFWTFLMLLAAGVASCFLPLRLLYPQLALILLPPCAAWVMAHGPGEPAFDAIGAIGLCTAVLVLVGKLQTRHRRKGLELARANESLTRALRERSRALADAHWFKSQLLVAVSQDLRQPAHALGMLIDLLNTSDGVTRRRRLRLVQSCVDMLADILAQLFDFNRLELGLYAPKLQAVELARVCDDARRIFEAQARQKGLALKFEVQPLYVRSDVRLLRRILYNLISNAIKFTPAGTITVRCAERFGSVLLVVADTGIGMGAARLDKLFDDPSASDERRGWLEGAGLGLSLVRRAVALLDHRIEAVSRAGMGSTFTVSLGLPQPRPQKAAAAAPPSMAIERAAVAVLEDDPNVLAGLLDTFRSWGCRVAGAGNLAQLESALARDAVAPTLFVSDLHLNGEASGFQAIDALRARLGQPNLPAILLTGDLDPLLETRARQGAIWLEHKPLRPGRLKALVLRALEGHAGTQARSEGHAR